jgi:chemotaxis protein MotB
MAGGGGGAWKVAYADFVTAMMAFFMVMWLVSQKNEVKESIAHYFQDPWHSGDTDEESTNKPHPEAKGHKKKGTGYEKSNSKKADGPSAKKPRTLLMREAQRTGLGVSVPFPDFSTELTADATEALREFLPQIQGKPHKLEVRGHTSRRPLADDSKLTDLWQLSFARCMSTMKFLEEAGVDPKRMRLAQSAGYEPIFPEATADSLEFNSRVEIFVLNEMVTEEGTPGEKVAGMAGSSRGQNSGDH